MASKTMTTGQLKAEIKRLKAIITSSGAGHWTNKGAEGEMVFVGTGGKTMLSARKMKTGRWQVVTAY